MIANSSINPEAGSALALSEKIVDSLLRVAEAAAFSDNDDLLLPTLAALNNLSFYSIVHQKQTYSSLKPFLHCSNVQVSTFNRPLFKAVIQKKLDHSVFENFVWGFHNGLAFYLKI